MQTKCNQFISLVLFFAILATIISSTHTPIYANTKSGNTSGNLDNGARIAISGDWIYYANYDNTICKMKTDGTNFTVIMNPSNTDISSITGLNVIGNWIYYVKTTIRNGKAFNRLYKMNTNGSDEKLLTKDDVSPYGTVTVHNGWIYYNCDDSIYKIKTNGTKRTKLAEIGDYNLMSFCISGKWIYYVDLSKGIFKVRTNGKSNKCIKKAKNLQSCQIYNGWLYYRTSEDAVYKIKTNGKKNTKIISNVLTYNVNDGWIYYSKNNKGFYKIKINGTSKKKLSKMNPLVVNIINEQIYFINSVNRTWYYYKMNTDGENLQTLWH